MRLADWLHCLRGPVVSFTPSRCYREARRRRHVALRWDLSCRQIEVLEDRTLLAAPHPVDLSALTGTTGLRLDGVAADDSEGEEDGEDGAEEEDREEGHPEDRGSGERGRIDDPLGACECAGVAEREMGADGI